MQLSSVFNGAIARIILRYGVGLTLGMNTGSILAADPDVVVLVAAGVGVATESLYSVAKKRGWVT